MKKIVRQEDLTKTYDLCMFLNYESSNDFSIYQVGYQACDPGYSYGSTIRPRAIFHYVKKGSGTLIIEDKEYKIGAKQGFLIPANMLSYYEADEEDPWAYYWIHVDGPRVNDLFLQAGIDSNQPIFTSTEVDNTLEDVMRSLLLHYRQEYYCLGKVYEFFDYLTSHSVTRQEPNISAKLGYIKNVIRYIQLMYADQINVEIIARECGLNRSYLTRVFKEATGTTIQEYLNSYRMKVAADKLKNTDISIQQISCSVGYGDTFTFSKAFKRFYSHSPSEYREISKSTPSYEAQKIQPGPDPDAKRIL